LVIGFLHKDTSISLLLFLVSAEMTLFFGKSSVNNENDKSFAENEKRQLVKNIIFAFGKTKNHQI